MRLSFFALSAAALLATSANASTNLLTNPGFSGTNDYWYSPAATNLNEVPGWTLTGYGFLSYPGLATSAQQQGGDQRIAGGPTDATCPVGACPNGFVDAPNGGNFLAVDGDPTILGTVSQVVNGFVIGKTYNISFDWAAAQQHDKSGPTTDQFVVSLFGTSQSTAVVALPSRGFQGWMHESFNFVATSTSSTLQFLSNGTPEGLPPLALLSGGLSLSQVPEAGSLALLGFGGIGLIAVARRRK